MLHFGWQPSPEACLVQSNVNCRSITVIYSTIECGQVTESTSAGEEGGGQEV